MCGLRSCAARLRRLALHCSGIRMLRCSSAQGCQLDSNAAASARHQRTVYWLQAQTRSRFAQLHCLGLAPALCCNKISAAARPPLQPQNPGASTVGDGGMHPQHLDWGMQCLSPLLAATSLCQSSQCHIQLSVFSVDCHSSCMNGDIWRWHSTSHHSLEDLLLKLANTICYINGPRA